GMRGRPPALRPAHFHTGRRRRRFAFAGRVLMTPHRTGTRSTVRKGCILRTACYLRPTASFPCARGPPLRFVPAGGACGGHPRCPPPLQRPGGASMSRGKRWLTITGCAALFVFTAACSGELPSEPDTGIELAMGRVALAGQLGAIPGYGCAIKRDETLVCWGLNTAGRLGIGSIDKDGVPYPATPVLIPAGVKLSFVTTGFRHACAVALDGRLFCWGANDYGQLGTGDREPS